MQKIILIINMLCLTQLFAQDPQLFENTWYLQNVIIDGNDNFPPSNEEGEFIQANFYNDNSFETVVCGSLSGILIYSTDAFSFDSSAITLIGCGQQVNDDYQNLYINDYFEQTIDNPYSYLVTQNGSALELIVTNSNSDTAIYSNVLLSVKDNQQLAVKIYPNPTTGQFKVQLAEGLLYAIEVYDITGKVVKTVSDYRNNEEIDISAQRSGVYFLKISNTHGSYKMLKLNKI